jgi:hypothetical protein
MTTEQWTNKDLKEHVEEHGIEFTITCLNPEIIIDENIKEKWIQAQELISSISQTLDEVDMRESFELEGIKFYYDPKEILIGKQLEEYLKQFGEQESYSIYIDESQGIVVF